MTDQERIARLEITVENLDQAIREVKEEQCAYRDAREESNLTMSEVRGQLATLIVDLKDHKRAHDDARKENKETKYKATDIILALGMIVLSVMTYLK